MLGFFGVASAASTAGERACLIVESHRGGAILATFAFADAAPPRFTIAFEHSVLGTTVHDHYEWRTHDGAGAAWLLEERFRGEGYGLPHTAAEGEQLVRNGDDWQLQLNRKVEPLVVRPLRAQSMRLSIEGKEFLLAQFNANNSEAAQLLRFSRC